MFAVIKTGGKQYRVAADTLIEVATIAGEPGTAVTFGEVILFGDGEGATQVGAPMLTGVNVTGEVVRQDRGAKVIAFKKRRRQNSRRKRGHRQDFTVIRITGIEAGGKKSEAKARPAKATPAKAESEPAAAEA